MRITKLTIKSYKNLQDFSWELNADYPVAVIVGKNGSGKTNLLEAIITIFQDLQLYSDKDQRNKSLPKFEFELDYQHGEDNDKINIKNNGKLEITKNSKNVPLNQLETLRQDAFQRENILPKSIFVYYAGTSNRLNNLTFKSIRQYRESARYSDSQSAPSQPLFYYEPLHYRCVFFVLLISKLDSIKKNFLKDLGIEKFESVRFIIEKPRQNNSTNVNSFWDAPIYLQRFLKFIKEKGYRKDINKYRNQLIYDVSAKVFDDEFISSFGFESGVFQQLSNLVLTQYLRNIEIHFKKSETKETLEFGDLSEGEWQRIAIRGAMEIFRGEETLFLLDEPDTFAHPRWQWEFVPDLKEAIGENKYMQAIFITHSPLVLSSVEKNAFFMEAGQIHVLQENFGQDANMSLAKMDVNPQMQEVVDDFQLYYGLIKDGKGESEKALAERTRLEEIYGLNHEKFDSADIMISFYK
jgi:AAA15 family ATPase/GTPase